MLFSKKFKSINMRFISVVIFLLSMLIMASCENTQQNKMVPNQNKEIIQEKVPEFNSDSAYSFVAKQVEFGPRVPGTPAHSECSDWLVKKFESYKGKVYVQDFKTRVYNGKIFSGKNIIASFNSNAKKRIMLSSHWDSRPYADYDPDPLNHYKPIYGANDGASGVGILLEIARQIYIESPAIGVDIFLWDLEDYGEHRETAGNHENSWGLGSQYWSSNPHIPGYKAAYGILLDMVGAENPTFYHEYYSQQYASSVLENVWNIAEKLGYSAYFINEDAGVVMDDHYYINTIAHIPTIDIIHNNSENQAGFFPQWHTTGDNMNIISKSTLFIVGNTLINLIYHK